MLGRIEFAGADGTHLHPPAVRSWNIASREAHVLLDAPKTKATRVRVRHGLIDLAKLGADVACSGSAIQLSHPASVGQTQCLNPRSLASVEMSVGWIQTG
jgi:hypothetical protein